MKAPSLLGVCLCGLLSVSAVAVDYRVEPLKESPPADELSGDIAATLSPEGLRVIRGTKTTYCDIWLCKQWAVKADFKPTSETLYPYQEGQLIGVARFSRKGGDFRDQEISQGVYTLRYAQQPIDGNHEGTSPTRDFLLLIHADGDQSPAALDEQALNDQSSAVVNSNHPAMLCLRRVVEAAKQYPAMRHDEENDWWIVGFQGKAKASDKVADLPVEVVIVGHADE